MIDKDDKRYITRQQTGDGNNPALYQAFPIIDRDGDGKLTEEELRAWVALATESAGCVPTISVADNGRALFELLDVNNDGRLTLRELRGAWARLAPYDHDGDGAISREEIPQQFQLTVLESGVDPNVFQQQVAMGQPQVAQPPQPAHIERGPLWFRKMDVNGDGDVSPPRVPRQSGGFQAHRYGRRRPYQRGGGGGLRRDDAGEEGREIGISTFLSVSRDAQRSAPSPALRCASRLTNAFHLSLPGGASAGSSLM